MDSRFLCDLQPENQDNCGFYFTNSRALRKEGITIRVCVIGMGYVGVPLAIEFARGGLEVVGVDVDPEKVAAINAGESYIPDVPSATIRDLVDAKLFRASASFDVINKVDAVCICVPTPLRKSQDPDISYIVAAVDEIAPRLRSSMLVVLESTTYPGTTDELVLPRLEATGLSVGEDFFLAFSPERVDPANKQYTTRNTPKVVGGVTPACTERALQLYRHAVETVVTVTNARTAEMVKLLENTFRAVNIGMVNELAQICDRIDVDVWDVIDAAKTKPFGFMPFYPGPGLGGHCIPIDPLYLSWKLKTLDYNARFIELASDVNASMPQYVLEKIVDALNGISKSVKGSKVLILGLAYKKDVSDVRESPALDIIGMLRQKGALITYSDPFVDEIELLGDTLTNYPLENGAQGFDIAVIITNHSAFDYARLLAEATLVFDTRNATAGLTPPPSCTLIKL